MSKISRRSLLKQSAFAIGGLGFSAKSYRAVVASDPPSERIRVGLIGVGNQGGPNNNMKYFLKNIVAMCDVDKGHLGEADSFLQKEANLNAMLTDDYRRILAAKDIDAVVVTVPDQWHALMTIEACKAGKDVYCEKPLTLVVGEGKPMIAAARENKRVVQTGSMQRSGEEFKLAVRLVRSGLLGPVSRVNVSLPSPNWIDRAKMPVPDSAPPQSLDFERWLGPAPLRPYNKNRVHYLFRFFWDYSGGQQTNFGAHHLDIAQWGLGMDDSGPVSIEGSATYNQDGWYETPDSTIINYLYANGVKMTVRQQLPAPNVKHGTEFIGDKGSLFVFRGGISAHPRELLTKIELPKITSTQANVAHVNNFFECVKSREIPSAEIAIGHRSATVCHLGNIAVRTNRKINWDPVGEMITDDAEASNLLNKEYRQPWTPG